jgi:hypothetical protein
LRDLNLLNNLAAGHGAEDLAAGEEEDFPFAPFEVDGAVDEGALAQFEDLFALKGHVFADGDRFEAAVCEDRFLGEEKEGLFAGGADGLEGAGDGAALVDRCIGEVGLAGDVDGADFSGFGDEASRYLKRIEDGGAIELDEAAALQSFEGDGAIRINAHGGFGFFDRRGLDRLRSRGERGEEAERKESEDGSAPIHHPPLISVGMAGFDGRGKGCRCGSCDRA